MCKHPAAANRSHKQALRDAPPSYKTRNEKKPEETNPETTDKTNENIIIKVVKNIIV
jgi:hypothetical protein